MSILAASFPATNLGALWCCENFLCGPSKLDPIKDDVSAPSHFFSPCADALSFPIPRQQSVAATFTGVGFWRDPLNVARFVMPVGVYAIKLIRLARMIANSGANLLGKLGINPPGLMNGDAAPPIEGIGIHFGIETTFVECDPTPMQRGSAFTMLWGLAACAPIHRLASNGAII